MGKFIGIFGAKMFYMRIQATYALLAIATDISLFFQKSIMYLMFNCR